MRCRLGETGKPVRGREEEKREKSVD